MRVAGLLLTICLHAAALAEEGVVDLQTVTVKPGDTLWSISNAYLQDPSKWDEILRYNKLPLKDPTVALPGTSLRIPVRMMRAEYQAARILFVKNKAFGRRRTGGDWRPLSEHMQVFRGDTVRTIEDSELIVIFIDHSLLQLLSKSEAVVAPKGAKYDLELKRGALVTADKKVSVAGAAVSAGPNAVYTAAVLPDHSTLVQVAEGEATVSAAGKSIRVKAGMATEVRPGAVPSMPFKAPDLAALQALASSFRTRLSAAAGKSAVVLRKVQDAALEALPERRAVEDRELGFGELMRETSWAGDLGTLEPISAYHVQCSVSATFSQLAVDKIFSIGAQPSRAGLDLSAGRYWCRTAAIDLLGEKKNWNAVKRYAF